jgi:hypothetical protein
MQRPNLSNCVDAVVPIRGSSIADYLHQLRAECAPAIRALQARKAIVWYSFLVHNRASAGREDLPVAFPEPFIHFRFSPPNGAAQNELLDSLPNPFLHPVGATLGAVGGIDVAAVHGSWTDTWWMIGEASDWVLKLVEVHLVTSRTLYRKCFSFCTTSLMV